MSYKVNYQGPFLSKIWSSNASAGRVAGHPYETLAFNEQLPEGRKRILLLIQNADTVEANIYFSTSATGTPLKLYAGQSISIDNYNGPIAVSTAGTLSSIRLFESFN